MSYNRGQFAERLKEICLLRIGETGDPQKALEDLTKKKQSSVWEWLNGKAVPSEENLLKIIEWSGSTADYLLFARGPKTRQGDKVEDQLLYFYRHLTKPDDRIQFVQQCNWIFSRMEPNLIGPANPYAGIAKEPPKPPVKPPIDIAEDHPEPERGRKVAVMSRRKAKPKRKK